MLIIAFMCFYVLEIGRSLLLQIFVEVAVVLMASIFCTSAMVIGFSQRSQTVVENGTFTLPIHVHALRTSEIEYQVAFHIVETYTTTATVDANNFRRETMSDALFGKRNEEENDIEDSRVLSIGNSEFTQLTQLTTFIENDNRVENTECFTIEIISPNNSFGNFSCNEDGDNATDIFCLHTVCIDDDDG